MLLPEPGVIHCSCLAGQQLQLGFSTHLPAAGKAAHRTATFQLSSLTPLEKRLMHTLARY